MPNSLGLATPLEKKNNAQKITEALANNENEVANIQVHKIPKTNLWLTGTSRNKKWTIRICNPLSTTSRLVSKDTNTEDYYHIWRLLTSTPLPDTIKHAVHEAKKHVQQLIQNKIINQ